jgi:hypothetical protein
MSLFRRILNFQKSDLKDVERRFDKRFPVAPAFTLATSLSIAGRVCSGRVSNLSSEGLGFLADYDPGLTAVGSPARVALGLDDFAISLAGEVKHVRPTDGGFLCGLALTFDEFETRKSYLQLMLPVVIGASLHRIADNLVRQDEPGLHKTVFTGESLSKLTYWTRCAPPQLPDSFELRLDEYYVKGRADPRGLQTFSLSDDARAHRGREATALPFVSSELDREIRQLFRWAVQNMQDNVPGDIRGFLATFAD